MNQFLACFLACAFVQLLSIVSATQYVAWRNRKQAVRDEAAQVAHAAQMANLRIKNDGAIANQELEIAELDRMMAESEQRRNAFIAEGARHDARMAKVAAAAPEDFAEMNRRSDIMDIGVGIKQLSDFQNCPACGGHLALEAAKI